MRSPGRKVSRGISSSRRTMRLAAAEVDDDVAVLDALDDAVDDLADAVLVFLVLAVALGLAHLLHDDLLGGLRRDAAEVEGRQRLGDRVADLGGRVALARLRQRDLAGVVLDRGVVDDEQVARQAELAGLRVDLGVDVGLGAVARARRLGDGVLHGVEDDLRSMTFSRATASAICKSSSLLALTAIEVTPSPDSSWSSNSTCSSCSSAGRPRATCPGGLFRRGFRERGLSSSASSSSLIAGFRPVGRGAVPRRRDSRISASVSTSRASPRSARGSRAQALLAFLHVRQLDHHRIVLDAADEAAETLAAVDGGRHLDAWPRSRPSARNRSHARGGGRCRATRSRDNRPGRRDPRGRGSARPRG